jgi:uncharacterized protein (DUF2236 family)
MPFTPYTFTSPDDPGREDDGLFGPGSVTWRIMSSRIMWVAALRALYLQTLHPRVVRGTLQNAPGITQPLRENLYAVDVRRHFVPAWIVSWS